MDAITISMFKGMEKQVQMARYNEIYKHELAHKNAGGALAGNIVIEKDSSGMPIGGHVPIKMPKLNPKNPQETIEQAKTVKRAALAPADPSSQDYKVAAEADLIKAHAENISAQKHLDYYA